MKMSKEKHFKIYDGQEPVKLIEFLDDGTINFANDEIKMIFEAGVKHAQSKANNSVLDDVMTELPDFLYRDLEGIWIGYKGDSEVTEEWSRFIKKLGYSL